QRSDVVFGLVLCVWFFISDGTFTLLRRLFRGERIWVAHRSHLYQRLTKTDLRHDQVTLRVLGAGAVLAAVGALSLRFSMPILQWTGVSIALGGFLVYYVYTLLRERAYSGSRVRFVSPSPYYKRPSRS